MRLYLAATVDDVRTLVSGGSWTTVTYAWVTDALKAGLPEADQDEWEYHAFVDAADLSAGRLPASTPPGEALRVVVSVDVDAHLHDCDGGVDAEPVTISREHVACIHVDESAAGRPEDRDLLWYSNDEMSDWLASLN